MDEEIDRILYVQDGRLNFITCFDCDKLGPILLIKILFKHWLQLFSCETIVLYCMLTIGTRTLINLFIC